MNLVLLSSAFTASGVNAERRVSLAEEGIEMDAERRVSLAEQGIEMEVKGLRICQR